jgi:hypothetical protein
VSRDLAYELVDRGQRRLRNVASPVRVFEARAAWAGAASPLLAGRAA